MARRIDYSARYQYTVPQIYAAMSNPDYWEARVEEMRQYSPNHVEKFHADSNGIEIELQHILPRTELPDIAQAVIRKDMVITRKESYSALGDEVTGTWNASIPAGPGSLGGTVRLFSTDTGSTLRTSSEAKVYIPMVGPKLEQLMLVNLVDLFRAEAAATVTWLEKNPPSA